MATTHSSEFNHMGDGYWQRLRDAAADMTRKDLDDLKHHTVDPSLCLIERDRRRMASQQMEMAFIRARLSHLDKGGFFANLRALDVIIGHNPIKLLHP